MSSDLHSYPSSEHLIAYREASVAHLRFNRPERMNAFNNELMEETIELMHALNADEAVQVIVVSGAGRTFSAGFDLKAAAERQLDSVDKVRAQMSLQFDFITQFWTSRKPTIAAVHGYCIAGAFELSLACDLTVCADDALFGEPEVRFGTGTVAMLFPWLTGPKQAKELVLLGDDKVSAARALEMGIVNRVVAPEQVLATAQNLAQKMARASSVSVQRSKEAINRAYDIMGMREALRCGLDIDVEINSTPSFEKTEFARIRAEAGLKAAIAWRDARFADPE
jgi:enoyl-CoA hydratase